MLNVAVIAEQTKTDQYSVTLTISLYYTTNYYFFMIIRGMEIFVYLILMWMPWTRCFFQAIQIVRFLVARLTAQENRHNLGIGGPSQREGRTKLAAVFKVEKLMRNAVENHDEAGSLKNDDTVLASFSLEYYHHFAGSGYYLHYRLLD